MDTGLGRDGYSMIGQGKIDSIVAARSEDRREIFEEAAGISRFRYRKEEAERRLEKAEENLLRLRDIVGELEDRINPLREQAEKAQRFLTLSEEKKTLEIGLWLETLNRSGRILREQGGKIELVQSQQSEITEELDTLAARIEETYTAINTCSVQMEELRNQAASDEESAARMEGEISVWKMISGTPSRILRGFRKRWSSPLLPRKIWIGKLPPVKRKCRSRSRKLLHGSGSFRKLPTVWAISAGVLTKQPVK